MIKCMDVYYVISNIVVMHGEVLYYSFFDLAFSSPPASHNKENKRKPMLVLIAPV